MFSLFYLIMVVGIFVLFAVFSVDFRNVKWLLMMFASSRLSFHLPLVLTFTVKSQNKKSKRGKTTCRPPKGLQYHEEDPQPVNTICHPPKELELKRRWSESCIKFQYHEEDPKPFKTTYHPPMELQYHEEDQIDPSVTSDKHVKTSLVHQQKLELKRRWSEPFIKFHYHKEDPKPFRTTSHPPRKLLYNEEVEVEIEPSVTSD
jgi:hypothetical protein